MAVTVKGVVRFSGDLEQCRLVARQLRSRPSIAHLVEIVEIVNGVRITLG